MICLCVLTRVIDNLIPGNLGSSDRNCGENARDNEESVGR